MVYDELKYSYTWKDEYCLPFETQWARIAKFCFLNGVSWFYVTKNIKLRNRICAKMDYAIDEPQEEKIKYLVNGYINVASIPNPQEDVVRIFYDTLVQMNFLDIRVLKLYTPNSGDNYVNIMSDYQIDSYQYNMVREKLARLGLIYSTNDEKRDENTDAIVKYLEDMNKGKSPKLRVKQVSRSESYRLSSYGNRFIKFIESEYTSNYDECQRSE